uniref:Uncharacterized protein n=1 Tax=Anguilla anguilla TaxID=7936 RepID=A0A0E9XSS7_ANGAN
MKIVCMFCWLRSYCQGVLLPIDLFLTDISSFSGLKIRSEIQSIQSIYYYYYSHF